MWRLPDAGEVLATGKKCGIKDQLSITKSRKAQVYFVEKMGMEDEKIYPTE